jgi:5-methylcytosine-specific restriction endonuclease McrA
MRNHNKRKNDKIQGARGSAFIQQVKMSIGKCQKCGLICDLNRLYDFHFDHIDPKLKRRNVSSMTRYGINEIRKEIEKCQLLCRGCHMERTKEQGYYAFKEEKLFTFYSADQLELDL